jgi:DNA polymerase-1
MESEAEQWLRGLGATSGADVGLALVPRVGLGLVYDGRAAGFTTGDPAEVVAAIERELAPRWVWWDRETADPLAAAAVPVQRCWDVLTVHRLLHGGWRTSPAIVWAWLHDLDTTALPSMGQLGLLDVAADEGRDPEQPVRPDGHVRPEWASGGWAATPARMAAWAGLAITAAAIQRVRLEAGPLPERSASTARSESAAEFLCAELDVGGLPIDTDEAERIIAEAVGPRPRSLDDAERARLERDAAVLGLLDPGPSVDLRNPADVKSMLRRLAIDVPDTRAWRLEQLRDQHPVVEALLTWRKAERIATTYGYRWLDEHVAGGRLRGDWSSSDGAAGRMTASAGLHNLPSEMRPAVAAEPGHVFVRADLGQIEPRVLAAVSGDAALIAATTDADLYQPVAERLGVTRDIAKVAVLGAMYGSTTGTSAHALRGLERNYPTAMAVLERAAAAGRAGDDVFTIGGRRVRMWVDDRIEGDIDRARSVAAARGRFARNALIQGAAAEFFKVWAVTVRARTRPHGAAIVLCLHDELLVHAPDDQGDVVAAALVDALDDPSALTLAAQAAANRYHAAERDSRVAPAPGTELPADLAHDFLDHPWPAEQVLQLLAETGEVGAVRSTGGRYFGFVTGGVEPIARAAATLAAAWDQNAALPVMSPAASRLDAIATGWVVELLGLPDGSVASFCAGATVANLTGVIVGRDALLRRVGWDVSVRGMAGSPPISVVVGDEIHISAERALRLAGFGTDQVVRVPTDECGRMRADAFPATAGPALVLLQAGNVNTGHSDPFGAIIPGLDRSRTWVHVDGAFGLWAQVAPARRSSLAGVELADSWATDGHKWLNVPYDCGIVICRDGGELSRAMSSTAAYVATGASERVPMNLGIQMSQAPRAIPAWAVMATLGRAGLAAMIERTCALAERFAGILVEAGVELLAPVALNQVLVAFGDDATTDAVVAGVQRSGVCWMGSTAWHGRRAMRISVSDSSTTEHDIDVSAQAVLEAWQAVTRSGTV